jgi:anti-sigma factor RsiW
MRCDVQCDETIIHGYLDGELDVVRAAEVELHVDTCARCRESLETLSAMQTHVRDGGLYARAPERLKRRMAREVRPRQWSRRAFSTSLAVACGALAAAFLVPREHAGNPLIDAHLRAMQPGHASDVVSTDQHTVKPWFDGKLDFSPPVRDFADEGFALQGGRLDIIDGRTVAAMVYTRRKHVIDLFAWPGDAGERAAKTGRDRGYNWITWSQNGMEMRLVSDMNEGELGEFQKLIASANKQ